MNYEKNCSAWIWINKLLLSTIKSYLRATNWAVNIDAFKNVIYEQVKVYSLLERIFKVDSW